MDCELKRHTDIVARRALGSSEAAQLVTCFYLTLTTYHLQSQRGRCEGSSPAVWTASVFYLALARFAQLMATAVAKHKRRKTDVLFGVLGGFFASGLMGLWLWLLALWARDDYFGVCSEAHDLFGFVYLAGGAFMAFVVVLHAVGLLFRLIRPKQRTLADESGYGQPLAASSIGGLDGYAPPNYQYSAY